MGAQVVPVSPRVNPAAFTDVVGVATDPARMGAIGSNPADGAFGFLAGDDLQFNQHVGVYGESDQQGVMGLTTVPRGTGVYGGGTTTASGDQIGVRGETATGVGIQGQSFGAGVGVSGISDKGDGVRAFSNSGNGLSARSNNSVAIFAESQNSTGIVGIGHQQPGVNGVSDSNDGVRAMSNSGNGVSAFGGGDNGVGIFAQASAKRNPAAGNNPNAGFFDGNVVVTGNLNMSSPTSDITLADVAEGFSTQDGETIEPGTVVVLNQYGLLRAGDEAYDKKVAGVVSGAGDYRPAIVLDKQHSQTDRLPVALMGKVYCKVDAQYAPIEVGDLLTTSPTPGHAMKAADPLKGFGSVIGKALRPLNGGQGMIPILIALQ